MINRLAGMRAGLDKAINVVHPAINAVGGIPQMLAGSPVIREGMRTQPAMRGSEDVSVMPSAQGLYDAYEKRVNDVGGGRKADDLNINIENPGAPSDTFEGKLDAVLHPNKYAGESGKSKDNKRNIQINPNVDRVLLAHEMGHHVGQQTDVGAMLHNLRHSPALKKGITQAALLAAPAGLAALVPGDDDMLASAAIAVTAAAPTILDEANATRHALAMMDTAGMRADLGQRGKLAGGLLSYVAAPLVTGGLANLIGNQFDKEQTPGTVMP